MKHSFLKQTQAFISHKRINGQASPEAILVKNALDTDATFNAFMDVREEYIGQFPNKLREKILSSRVFLLILPTTNDISFLFNKGNWVRKEISIALSINEIKDDSIKIIPIAFNKDFTWPDKNELEEISPIVDYNIFYYDTNAKESSKKLLKAMKCKPQINWIKVICSFVLMLMLAFLITKVIPVNNEYRYEQSKVYMSKIEKETSFNHYLEAEQDYTNTYLNWVYGQMTTGNKDLKLMKEFNKCYIKGRCVRMIVLAYLAFTNGDLDYVHSQETVNELVEAIYAKIPEENKAIFSYTNDSKLQRKKKLEGVLDISIEYLESKSDLRKLNGTLQKEMLKATLMKRLWVSDGK